MNGIPNAILFLIREKKVIIIFASADSPAQFFFFI